MIQDITYTVILALGVGSLSITISKGNAFDWLRKKINWEIFSCPFCLSFWSSLWCAIAFDISLLPGWYPLSLLMTSFAMTTIASISAGLIERLLD